MDGVWQSMRINKKGEIMKQSYDSSKGYRKLSFQFRLPFTKQNFYFQAENWPEAEKTLGITNRTEDGNYVIFLDYDDMELSEVVDDCMRLQCDWSLGNFYLFKLGREKSFHAICCSMLNARSVYEIIGESCADAAFRNAPRLFQRSRWILRIGPKGQRTAPEYLMKVQNDGVYQESEGHLLFLKKYYGVKDILLEEKPNNPKVQYVEYGTFNRVGK